MYICIFSDSMSNDSSDPVSTPGDWTFFKRGVPLMVLDSGEGRRHRRLSIVLAERGTGFTLWSDTIDHLTSYTPDSSLAFHTMRLSKVAYTLLINNVNDVTKLLQSVSYLLCYKSSHIITLNFCIIFIYNTQLFLFVR